MLSGSFDELMRHLGWHCDDRPMLHCRITSRLALKDERELSRATEY